MEVTVVGRQAVGAVNPKAAAIWSRRGGAEKGALWRSMSRASFPRRAHAGRSMSKGRAPPATSAAVDSRNMGGGTETKKAGMPRSQQDRQSPDLIVGLPFDIISDTNSLNHAKAMAVGLKALKLLGVDGVQLPIWWGVVEKDAMGEYNWSSYLALVEMIRDMGLQVHASLCFHAIETSGVAIPLPSWIQNIGDADPDIYFTDRDGRRHKECLSFAVDDLPVLSGKTPVQVYEGFCRGFEAAFEDLLGSTITDISIGLGPGGELRYPSMSSSKDPTSTTGVGEFQCYDKYTRTFLQLCADSYGNHNWGLSGPHNAPRCDQSLDSADFFKEQGQGSWDTPYGDFFLKWYSHHLLTHGDRMLSTAASIFGPAHHPGLTISAKVPLVHSWYQTGAHPSELTAGYYNTVHRDGYDAVAEMFARNSCRMAVPGMDLSDKHQPRESKSSPEALVSQIMTACYKHSVRISGENQSVSSGAPAADSFDMIKGRVLCEDSVVDCFTYQRMGAHFFSPDHWPRFTEFVRSRSADRIQLHPYDTEAAAQGDGSLLLPPVADRVMGGRELQAV